MIVIIILVALLCAVMGVLIIFGKGDNLIAGYNTAPRREREKYDIKRLRGLTGGLLLALAPMTFLLTGEPSIEKSVSFAVLVSVLSIIVVVLANTWAKKKSK